MSRIPECLTEDAIDSLVIPVNEVAAYCGVDNEVLLGVAVDMFAEFVSQCDSRSGESMERFLENATRYTGLGMFVENKFKS